MKKWNIRLDMYSGMKYFCVAETFEEAVAKARLHAEKLKKSEGLENAPDISCIEEDEGTFLE